VSNIYQFSRDGTPGTGRSGSLPDTLAAAATFDDASQLYQADSIYRHMLSKDQACEPARHRPGVLDFQAGQVVATLKLIGSAAVLRSENGVFSVCRSAIPRGQAREQEVRAGCRKCVAFDRKNLGVGNAESLSEDVCEARTCNLGARAFL